jgi:hypothetical protein
MKISAQGTVDWARAMGDGDGDELSRVVVELPDGAVIAFGGGVGKFDYSGNGTDIDNAPAWAYRVNADGSFGWVRRLHFGVSERSAAIADAVYDAANDDIIFVGTTNFEINSFITHITPAGTVTRVEQVVLDRQMLSTVSAVRIAPDGGLIIAGHEATQNNVVRDAYVARTDPTRTSFVWALRAPFSYSLHVERLTLSTRGDIVVATPAAGPLGKDTLVSRIGLDGSHDECSGWSPATLRIEPLGDASDVPIYTFLPLGPIPLDPLTPSEEPLPPGSASRCP